MCALSLFSRSGFRRAASTLGCTGFPSIPFELDERVTSVTLQILYRIECLRD